jgi:hypothetical protein
MSVIVAFQSTSQESRGANDDDLRHPPQQRTQRGKELNASWTTAMEPPFWIAPFSTLQRRSPTPHSGNAQRGATAVTGGSAVGRGSLRTTWLLHGSIQRMDSWSAASGSQEAEGPPANPSRRPGVPTHLHCRNGGEDV